MTMHKEKIPAILVTDLYFHFNYHSGNGTNNEMKFLGGIDDYFDCAQVLATDAFDVKGIVLDNHLHPKQLQDGRFVIDTMLKLMNKRVPVILGESKKITSINDHVYEAQGAEFIAQTIAINQSKKVALICTGGMTDIALALNQFKPLDKLDVDVYFSGGNYKTSIPEYNVSLDPLALTSVAKNKNINFVWAPADCCKWHFNVPELLSHEYTNLSIYLCNSLRMYRYAKQLLNGETPDKINFLDIYNKGSPMWSTPAILMAAQYNYEKDELFKVREMNVSFNEQGSFVGSRDSSSRMVKTVISVDEKKLNQVLADVLLSVKS